MLNKLRDRLFASYLLVLIIALMLVGLVTVTTLRQRDVPPEFTWNRLELLLSGFTSQQFVRDTITAESRGDTIPDMLDDFASSNDVRVLLVARNRGDNVVLYDSADEYEGRNAPDLQPIERSPQRGAEGQNNQRIGFGEFTVDDNQDWLYAGFRLNIVTRPRVDDLILYVAEPRSTDNVRAVVAEFNDLILRPLLRSAVIGGVIAFILAIFLTRNITKPLQALSKSAQHVARGEFGEEVPVSGPSEIQQVAIAFNRMTGEVRATQQAQREFMANVSHDLKTPLTSIQGYSQAIIDGAATDPAQAAEIIHDEAERLNRMVQELTDLARLQAGRLSMKLSPLDIGALVASVSERLAMVADRQKHITLTVTTHPTPMIAADGDRMVQVLNNLIGNAIKYTPERGNIRVTTGVRNGGIEIVIQDDGIGIPNSDLPHIFDRFYQVDKSRGPSRGTGLGLAITQEIIQGHGGTIHLFSDGINQGTTVTLWIPSPNVSTVTMRRVTAE